MKSKCQTRKNSIYAIFSLAFALLMLLCAILCVSLQEQFHLSWLQLRFEDAGRLVRATAALLPAACAVIVIGVCLTFCLGLRPRNLLIAAGALLLFSLCRYATDLYLTVKVECTEFYVISMDHIDLAFSFVIFLVTLLTVCNVFRSNIPLTLTAMTLGLFSSVLSVFRSGSFCRDGVTDISGTIYYLSGCMAVALCVLTPEWKSAADTPEQFASPAAQTALVSEAPAQQTVPQCTSEETLALLQQVEKLYENGILDEAEYREKCRKILEKV